MKHDDLSQLRLGNLLIQEGEGIINIGHIQRNWHGVLINGKAPECFEPIVLTEEWLNEFEFLNDGGDEWIKEIGDHSFIIEYFEYTKSYHYTAGNGLRLGKGCKYVHELQNLYFEIIGIRLLYI